MYVCMYACVCIYVCMYVCMYVRINSVGQMLREACGSSNGGLIRVRSVCIPVCMHVCMSNEVLTQIRRIHAYIHTLS